MFRTTFNNKFDEDTFYTTKSVLSVPLHDRNKNVAGVLQIINKIGSDYVPVAFESSDLSVVKVFCGECFGGDRKSKNNKRNDIKNDKNG
jgi:hypothetical protein